MPDPTGARPDRNLAMELVRVTEYGAMAAARWVGLLGANMILVGGALRQALGGRTRKPPGTL